MEKLLELDDIMLTPSDTNVGNRQSEYNFGITDELDKSVSLPLFTSPNSLIVDESNWKMWYDNGIRPIIPRTSPLSIRLEACGYIFAAFSLKEVIDNFISGRVQGRDGFLRICIDCGNGHDTEIFKVGAELKRIYGPRVITMAGGISSPKVYPDYCKAMFDYVRLGLPAFNSSEDFSFYYPAASLILDIKTSRNTVCVGLKHTKLVLDGGAVGPGQILKALAIGADYVMVGREFASLVDSAGEIFKKSTKENRYIPAPSDFKKELLSREVLNVLSENIYRPWFCSSIAWNQVPESDKYSLQHDWISLDSTKSDWIRISSTLKDWLEKFYNVCSYGFTMANATSWKEFKNGIKPIRVL